METVFPIGRRTKKNNNERWFQCTDCQNFKFTVHSQIYSRPYCPKCGDTISVKRISPPKMNARESYKEWTNDELRVVDRVIKGELQVYQAAFLLDRSRNSVDNKVRRTKRKRGIL